MIINYSLKARNSIEKAGFAYHLPREDRAKLFDVLHPYSQEAFKEKLQSELQNVSDDEFMKMIQQAIGIHRQIENENGDVVIEFK